MTSTSLANPAWTGVVPVDDTALAVTDTGGPGIPVVYLNGQFATVRSCVRTSAPSPRPYVRSPPSVAWIAEDTTSPRPESLSPAKDAALA
jgi:hypothetical protein